MKARASGNESEARGGYTKTSHKLWLGKNWRFFDIDEPLELRNLLNSPLVARATRKSAVYIEGSSSSQEDEAVEEKRIRFGH